MTGLSYLGVRAQFADQTPAEIQWTSRQGEFFKRRGMELENHGISDIQVNVVSGELRPVSTQIPTEAGGVHKQGVELGTRC